jgi:hypothetical protein
VASTITSAELEQSVDPSSLIDLLTAPPLMAGREVLKLITRELKNPALSAKPVVEQVTVSEKVCNAPPEQSVEA